MIVTIHQSNCPTSKRIWIWIMANQKISFYSAQFCSIHHLELLSNQMTAFPFAILNSCPITGWVAILNYCPIRRLLFIRHLAFLTNQRQAAPPNTPLGTELSLLHYFWMWCHSYKEQRKFKATMTMGYREQRTLFLQSIVITLHGQAFGTECKLKLNINGLGFSCIDGL